MFCQKLNADGGDPLSTFAQSVGVSWDVGLAVVKPGKSWANWDGGSSLFHGLNCASKLEKSFYVGDWSSIKNIPLRY